MDLCAGRSTNRSEDEIRLSVVDGVINVLPSGVDPGLDMGLRNLTNAYKRSELVSKENRLAVYSMESRVSDRPEPSEMPKGERRMVFLSGEF